MKGRKSSLTSSESLITESVFFLSLDLGKGLSASVGRETGWT